MKLAVRIFLMAVVAVSASASRAADYALDSAHASATFTISHLGFSRVAGALTDLSGEFSFDPEKPEASSVQVTAKAASINTFNEARDKHLRTEDFFNVEKFPELTFKSTAWKKTGENTYDVTGDFTLLGVTKSITIPVTHNGSGEGFKGEYRAGFSSSFKIKRSDFGMGGSIGPIGDEVSIEVSFEGIKK